MKLCDQCHQRAATRHAVTIVGGVAKQVDLCSTCGDKSAFEESLCRRMREARCPYCGRQPCAISTDFLALAVGVQAELIMCLKCKREFLRYCQQAMEKPAAGLSQAQQRKAIHVLRAAADKHMKQWVKRRKKV